MAFKEFQSCSKESFDECLDKYINREWDLGGFDFLLQYLSKNKNITKRQRRELLINYTGFNFINKLIDTINSSEINNFTCRNISSIINNLSKVGLTLRDLHGDSFAKAVIDLINDILDLNCNFESQDIANIFNGLAKLGYKKDNLVDFKDNHLNIKALTEQISNQINNFNSQDMANTFNGLAKLGYTSEDLKDLNIKFPTQQTNDQIEAFKPQEIADKSSIKKDTTFEEFQYCDQESFGKCLDKCINREWDLGSFGLLLQHFSKNTKIPEQQKCELLTKPHEYEVNIDSENKVFQFKFTDELIGAIYMLVTSGIDEYTCQNIANIINNLPKVGLTSKDLYYDETNMNFAEEVTGLINYIFENGYNFTPQEMFLILNGLVQLGYKEEDLVDFKDNHLNIKALTQGINNRIGEFKPQEIVDIFDRLVKLGYIKENLVDLNENHLNIESLTEQIKSQIESFKPKEIDNVSNSNKDMAFKEFQSCSKESFDKCLDKYINREWDLGGFDFLLQCFSENTKIPEQQKHGLLTKIHEYEVNIDGENEVFQFKFIEELAETVYRLARYKSGIDEYTCQNIANIINNLSKVGLTSKDLYFNGNMSFVEEAVTLINNILNSEINKSGYNFKSQEIANTLNGLAQLGYTSEDLKDLNIKALMQQINSQIDNFNSQDIANTFNGLAKLGYKNGNLSGLNIKALTEQINNRIEEFKPQEIVNTFNGLAKLGYGKKDLSGLDTKALTEQINKTVEDFDSQDIANTFNGLAKLGYKNGNLSGLNIKALTEQINNRIDNFKSQEIANTLNGLAKFGYGSEDLKDLNIGKLTERINNKIGKFKSQEIAVTLHGLGKIGYNFDELKESNIIQNLLKKFNSIQKNKTVLDYLTLMKGLAATVYDIKQDNLKEEQKQYLNELKTNIDKDVKKIVKGAKEKRKEITNATNLNDLNRMLIILGKQQAELEQQTKKVIEDERRLKRCSEKCKNTETTITKGELCAITETNKALNNITDAVLQKQ